MEEEKKEMTFSELIDTIAEGKGISRDSVLAALKEAMETSYIKFLKGGDDAIVEAKIIEEEDGSVQEAKKRRKKKTSSIFLPSSRPRKPTSNSITSIASIAHLTNLRSSPL